VAPERLVFAPRTAHWSEHLARQCAADLFLDTWPYNAHSTANDALWLGLPVLTLAGGCFAARVGASLLGTLGLRELITGSAAEYVARAIELGSDAAQRAALRAKLSAARTRSPLYDTQRRARHLEAAFFAIHERAQQGLAPQALRIEAAAT